MDLSNRKQLDCFYFHLRIVIAMVKNMGHGLAIFTKFRETSPIKTTIYYDKIMDY